MIWRDPQAVNLTGLVALVTYDGGYYLLSGPTHHSERLGVMLAFRAQQRDAYRLAHPISWRKALTEVLAMHGGAP